MVGFWRSKHEAEYSRILVCDRSLCVEQERERDYNVHENLFLQRRCLEYVENCCLAKPPTCHIFAICCEVGTSHW